MSIFSLRVSCDTQIYFRKSNKICNDWNCFNLIIQPIFVMCKCYIAYSMAFDSVFESFSFFFIYIASFDILGIIHSIYSFLLRWNLDLSFPLAKYSKPPLYFFTAHFIYHLLYFYSIQNLKRLFLRCVNRFHVIFVRICELWTTISAENAIIETGTNSEFSAVLFRI